MTRERLSLASAAGGNHLYENCSGETPFLCKKGVSPDPIPKKLQLWRLPLVAAANDSGWSPEALRGSNSHASWWPPDHDRSWGRGTALVRAAGGGSLERRFDGFASPEANETPFLKPPRDSLNPLRGFHGSLSRFPK
jgi:hypothetical protein